ncbi:4Fe-4S binding protein [bacterium]|nr:4Fe-4S binding protein [bacterium]
MVSRRIVLQFPHRLVDQPIVSNLVRKFDLEFNILKASVTPREEGLLVMELKGEKKAYEEGVAYLKDLGVTVQPLSQKIIRNMARCTHCGACVVICPTEALVLDIVSREVHFFETQCIGCELCIKACPTRAMEAHF